jgi:hypothetical protein
MQNTTCNVQCTGTVSTTQHSHDVAGRSQLPRGDSACGQICEDTKCGIDGEGAPLHAIG